jgi:uroporphyrin-III C-methyltransferase
LTPANSSTRGKVYLIGAGPGDPELLTLKAVRALAAADVLLIDDLVDRRVLEFAPRARVITVGKRGGCPSTPQRFIDKLMLRLACEGKIVARVKGGDPFMFGRGGEEMMALQQAGVEVEVVHGITAGIAAPGALGIPVTHRGCSQAVTFVTGHAQPGTRVNWRALALSGSTLVIYMGIGNLREITGELLVAGLASGTPAAAIQHGTLPAQRQLVSTLAQLADAVEQAGLGSPAIIVIGAVAALARQPRSSDRAIPASGAGAVDDQHTRPRLGPLARWQR